MAFRVLGIDPGFAALGWSVVEFDTLERFRFLEFDVITTEKSARKVGVRAVEDNFERTQTIVHGLAYAIKRYRPSLFAAETMSFPRSSSVAAKMAMSWGVIATLAWENFVPVVQTTPQAIKLSVCKDKKATKEQVEDAVRVLFENSAERLDLCTKRIKSRLHEHVFDSLAAVMAARNSELMKVLVVSSRGRK
jgi:crossover junction endodeoxyribonuclease RuvC